MPVDPKISLGVTGGASGMMQPGAAMPQNPLTMAQGLVELQNEINKARLFEGQFQARQQAGKILAEAPDMKTGVEALQADPLVTGFAPELAQTAASTYSTMLGAMGQQQTQGNDAYSNFIKQFPAVVADPTQWDAAVNNSLELASPAIREPLRKSFDYLRQSITAGLSDDPDRAKEQVLQRLTGFAVAAGAGESIPQILGQQGQFNTGDAIRTGTVAPPQGRPLWLGGGAPGSFQQGGNALGLKLAPQIAAPGGIPVGGAMGTPQSSGLAMPQPAATPNTAAGDGTPLIPEGFKMEGPKPRSDVLGGVPIGPAAEIAGQKAKDFAINGTAAYSNAQQTKALLHEMSVNYDTMAKGGGFLVPGTAAGLRSDLAKLANTFSQISGDTTPFDPAKVASAEQFVKDTRRMGLTVLTTMLGNQREAAETINNITQAVPAINNTYLGGKLLIASIEAATQRSMDQYEFQSAWQQANGGNLDGSDTAFNKLHPAENYAQAVMDKFGLTKTGFKDLESLSAAVRQGFLTPKEASDIAKKQGFKLPGAGGN